MNTRQKPSPIRLITFGGGSPNLRAAAKRLSRQAKASGFFSAVDAYTDEDLNTDEEFQRVHGAFVASNARGYGYWIWKPYLISKALGRAKDGEIFIYCDAGCEINGLGKRVLFEWADLINKHDILLFRMPSNYQGERWTKGDLLTRFPEMVGQAQISGAISGFKVSEKARRFLRFWYDLCQENNYRFLDDSSSVAKNYPNFVEHRHDQSCLSATVLAFSEAHILPNDPEFGKRDRMVRCPILIKRNKTGYRRIYSGSIATLGFFVFFKRRLLPRIHIIAMDA